MRIVLFATYYENKQMVAARRWRSLVFFLCKEGINFCVITPGKENKEYIGEYGETVCTFTSFFKKKNVTTNGREESNKRVIPTPFPYLDISFLKWMGVLKNKFLAKYCLKSDLIISTYGPSGGMLLGLVMAYKYNKPWVIDLRDSFQPDPIYNSKLLLKWNDFCEKKILKTASLSITVGRILSEYLYNKYHLHFEYIYNGWIDSDHISLELNPTNDEDYFLYAGAIYPHRLPALKVFLSSMQQTLNGKIKLRIRLLRDYSGYLTQWIHEHQFDSLVDILPPVDHETLSIEMSAARGMLVIEDLSPQDWQKGTVTGKLFSLLISGLPGIVIAHQDTEVSLLTSKAQGWFCADSVKNCQVAINNLLKVDKAILVDNRSVLSEYHFSHQAKKLMPLFKRIVDANP